MTKFLVSYELINEESAANGDVFDRGLVAEERVCLREALDLALDMHSVNGIESIEANCSDPECASWLTVYGGLVYNHNGNVWENRIIHFPRNITNASRVRLVKLLTK